MKLVIEKHNMIDENDTIEVLNAKLERIGHHLKIMMLVNEYKDLIEKVRSICIGKDVIISEMIYSPKYFNKGFGDLQSFINDGNKIIRKFTIKIYRKSDLDGNS